MSELDDILKDNKKEIREGINKQVLDFVEQQSEYNSHFAILYESYFNEYVVSAIRHYIVANFSLHVHEVYDHLDESYIKDLTGDYFFNKMNYYDKGVEQ